MVLSHLFLPFTPISYPYQEPVLHAQRRPFMTQEGSRCDPDQKGYLKFFFEIRLRVEFSHAVGYKGDFPLVLCGAVSSDDGLNCFCFHNGLILFFVRVSKTGIILRANKRTCRHIHTRIIGVQTNKHTCRHTHTHAYNHSIQTNKQTHKHL